MLYYVSNSDRHHVTFPKTPLKQAKNLLQKDLKIAKSINLDYETTGLNPLLGVLLLTAIKCSGNIYVVDNTSIPLTDFITSKDIEDKVVIAHNVQFEHGWSKVNGLNLNSVWCTYIAERVLTQGSGVGCGLVDTYHRRGLPLPEGMDKDIREDFIDNPNIILEDKHIIYSKGDVEDLDLLAKLQKGLIEAFNLQRRVYEIEFPLIGYISNAELKGFRHWTSLWLAYTKKKQKELDVIEEDLDNLLKDYNPNYYEIIPQLRNKKNSLIGKEDRLRLRIANAKVRIADYEEREKTHTKAYRAVVTSLEKAKKELEEAKDFDLTELEKINWNSSPQVVTLLKQLRIDPPMVKDQKTKKYKPGLAKEARGQWFLDNRKSPHIKLMRKFDEYKKLIHNINSFGETWVEKYINPVTGRVHTKFRQCGTDTGRLASGDANSGWFNMQQIPKEDLLRRAFIADEGYEMVTCDLSGAELCIMASLAQDMRLLELSQGDMHSHMANLGWKAIYEDRGKEWRDSDVISKHQNKEKRGDFKPMTFGIIYRMHDKKAGETLGVSKREGRIVIDQIKKEIPATFKMVEGAIDEAKSNGYVIFNKRTNSLRWFPKAMDALNGKEITFMDNVEIEGAAANCRIQGTQSDMLKEGIVTICRFIEDHNLDAYFMGTVHDENIFQYGRNLRVMCPYTNKEVGFGEYVATAMTEVANLYLKNVKMKCDYSIRTYWCK